MCGDIAQGKIAEACGERLAACVRRERACLYLALAASRSPHAFFFLAASRSPARLFFTTQSTRSETPASSR